MNTVFNIKSQRIDALIIKLANANLDEIIQTLESQSEKYKKFNNLPAILDVQNIAIEQKDTIANIIQQFRQAGLNIYSLSHTDSEWEQFSHTLSLAFTKQKIENNTQNETDDSQQSEHINKIKEATQTEITNEITHEGSHENHSDGMYEPVITMPARKTYVVNTPVRTGQQVYAEHADLIVLGMVSEGAEVIADGNIHIYAPMRGRALAGASGDIHARIFVQSMQAELVSIAGIYRVFERQLPDHLHRHAVQIELIEDRLSIAPIGAE